MADVAGSGAWSGQARHHGLVLDADGRTQAVLCAALPEAALMGISWGGDRPSGGDRVGLRGGGVGQAGRGRWVGKVNGGGGLCLGVRRRGGRWWRWGYRLTQ